MKTFVSAALAGFAALTSSAAAAADDISNPRGMVANFDAQNIGSLLSELGLVWQKRQTQEGQPYIAASVGGALMINLLPTACQGEAYTNCVGLHTIALFPGDGINYQTVLAFGQKYAFTSVVIAQDGSHAAISRYDIADFGIPRGNLASSLKNFVYLADVFRKEISSAANTVSLEGYPDDLSARLLNGRALADVGGGERAVGNFARHRQAFEESSELIRVLMNEGEAPRNKIDNLAGKP